MDLISGLVNGSAAGAVVATVLIFRGMVRDILSNHQRHCNETLDRLAESMDRHTEALTKHLERCAALRRKGLE